MKKKALKFAVLAIFVVMSCVLLGCAGGVKREKMNITVTLLNGEHYSEVGECKKNTDESGNASLTF